MAKQWPEARAAHDLEACRTLIRQGSKSFYAASLLLPPRVRGPAYALYAFCRLSDDAVDGPGARADAVARLRDRLERCYRGTPVDVPADRAFADLVAGAGLPQALPEALLEGLSWDSEGRQYRTLEELHAYAARVAASVGAMMTVLMGVRDPVVLARACDLGVAMQLTNIARDVGEDARAGRLYLPLAWLAEAGIDPAAFLARPVFDAALGRVVARVLAEAERLYCRAGPGVAGLPADCRPAIQAARLIYREIGIAVAGAGHDSIARRASVPTARKLALLVPALRDACRPGPMSRDGALPATRFLVEAAASMPSPRRAGTVHRPTAWVQLDWKVGRMIEMIGELERRRVESGRLPSLKDSLSTSYGGGGTAGEVWSCDEA
jgi:15-cis-phytoene synthase